ncbi:MAG: sulfotransferase family protein [Alphaproteobacteria bacterium CG11_big_fil_rev_8_21_14_0_20_39_49]|nr:MAG: sulfotransferase family protein [Alphaproteobacteria bacterium CG11_big_fil_rev_8_21_14_0_20_39_49]
MSDYSLGSKILHYIALSSPFIGQVCFDVECSFNKNKPEPKKPVFVAGLARAGTTMLMNNLYNTGEFISLTYRNMPFVLMPQVWTKFSTPFTKNKDKEQRAHGDGIMVNFDSAEAFEEVFWRCFDKNSYISRNALSLHEPSDEILDNFKKFVSNVLADGTGKRYLSKNNNNILRFPAIKNSFEDAVIIIPFRDPVQHAISMFKQHKLFSRMQSDDRFSLSYMNWLGHYEFGLGHKPFLFDKTVFSEYQADKIDYWLDYWIHVYSYLKDNFSQSYNFICYEDLCVKPATILTELYNIIEVDKALLQKNDVRHVIKHDEPTMNENSTKKAFKLYESLKSLTFYS